MLSQKKIINGFLVPFPDISIRFLSPAGLCLSCRYRPSAGTLDVEAHAVFSQRSALLWFAISNSTVPASLQLSLLQTGSADLPPTFQVPLEPLSRCTEMEIFIKLWSWNAPHMLKTKGKTEDATIMHTYIFTFYTKFTCYTFPDYFSNINRAMYQIAF